MSGAGTPFEAPASNPARAPVTPLDEAAIYARFPPRAHDSLPGFMRDFLGTRTRVAFLRGYERFDGATHGRPARGHEFLHEHDEWLGTLQSVIDAAPSGELTVLELGAGWAPWLVVAHAAARVIGGFRTVRLLGVEASADHHAMSLQHFADNGLDPAEHDLLLGAVAAADGTLRFPRLPDPAGEWGATPLDDAAAGITDRRGVAFDAFDEVPAYGLAGLVERFARVDLVHCDIQGGEDEAIPAAMAALGRRVRRMVVATHGTDIEHRLGHVFAGAGWRCEAWETCRSDNDGTLLRDGTQVWRNPTV